MENIHPIFDRIISKEDIEKRNEHKAITVWFTGLSGSGKSTIAERLERKLFNTGVNVRVVDGDNTRVGLCKDLTFSIDDRVENIRRVAELSKVLNDSGIVTLNSFVSPTYKMRALAKEIIGESNFIEVFVDTPLEVCEKRDVKGLYAKARRGEIKKFTGLDSPFEEPINADCHVKTVEQSIEESVNQVYQYIEDRIR